MMKRTSSKRRTSSKDHSRSETTTTTTTTTPILSSTPRSNLRPSLATRTNSAPLVPRVVASVDPDSDGSYSHRASVASIRDDPFFMNYQSPQTANLNRALSAAAYSVGLDEEEDEDPMELPLRSPKRIPTDGSVNLPPQSRSGMSDINIAVIGGFGVGKSTLIQRALGLRSLPGSAASSQRMSVDNVVYTVSLIELDLESFDIVPDRRIQWPKQINGHIVPRMDGALLLYDVTNRESVVELPQVLRGLVHSALPTILVSCKCDNPENTRQIDVESMEQACAVCVDAVKTAANVPESARLCLSSILRAVMTNRNAPSITSDNLGTRRRATSTANRETVADLARPMSSNSKQSHNRASSEYSLGRGQPVAASSREAHSTRTNGRTNLHQQFTLPNPNEAPPLSSHPAFRLESLPAEPSTKGASEQNAPSIAAAGRPTDNSFLDMEESDAESAYRYSDDIPILQRDDSTFFDKPAKVAGVTFDELVDRLLGQNMSRADNNFSDIFLCLYRKFAAPGELFAAIQSRLESIADDSNTHYLTRIANQLRIITVIAKWVTTYPGDFASPSTSNKLDTFITGLSGEPVFAAAAHEMRTQLQSRVFEDDDTGWARTDADLEVEAGNANDTPQAVSRAPVSPVRTRAAPQQHFEADSNNTTAKDEDREVLLPQESQVGASGRPVSPAPSFHSVEDYEREAAILVPKGNLPLTKFRYHIFMDMSDDDLADEITRIDWIMFSSIRLRDLVRHVSLPLEQKEKCKSLANVNRMINHFNHVAKWVSNMILIRDKAKHRALVLERFMTIALKLRQLNNYNGLAAVLAGINGSAIHRLAQTRALVPADVQKRFARLVILMGTQKSHFAYRLAWENSSLPRIPFIPLHRRDLVSAEEGSRTFVGANGERINWKKFEVLSEVILPIMKSQVVPYPNLVKIESARELILDCRLLADEEEVYQRSLQVESTSSSGSGAMDFGKKKFPWFQKEK